MGVDGLDDTEPVELTESVLFLGPVVDAVEPVELTEDVLFLGPVVDDVEPVELTEDVLVRTPTVGEFRRTKHERQTFTVESPLQILANLVQAR